MPNNKQKKIFVFDDDEDIINLLKHHLEKREMNCVSAKDLSEARFKVSNDRFDLIICDYNIGKRDSSGLLKQVRYEKSINVETPVILITASIKKEDFVAINNLINGVLIKPLDFERLDELLEKFAGKDSLVERPFVQAKS